MQSLSPDQARLLSDAQHHYAQYIELQQQKATLPNWMRWKNVNGKDYLTKGDSGGNNQKSLGPRSPETQALLDAFELQKAELATFEHELNRKLQERAPQLKALGLGRIPQSFARIVRQYDVEQVLEHYLWVGGTHALMCYEGLAGKLFSSELGATEDLDLFWANQKSELVTVKPPKNLLGVLKKIDKTYTVNAENRFQARNSKAQVIDFITSASGQKSTPNEHLSPIAIEGQDWLTLLPPVSSISIDSQGLPLRLISPDPRLFALHKLWVSQRHNRNPLKVHKDKLQGQAVIKLVQHSLPYLAFDDIFYKLLPQPLQAIFDDCCAQNLISSQTAEPPLM